MLLGVTVGGWHIYIYIYIERERERERFQIKHSAISYASHLYWSYLKPVPVYHTVDHQAVYANSYIIAQYSHDNTYVLLSVIKQLSRCARLLVLGQITTCTANMIANASIITCCKFKLLSRDASVYRSIGFGSAIRQIKHVCVASL